MAEFKRAQRVAEVLRAELSQIITQRVKDPTVGMVTITAVKLTDDLKSARVYVSRLGETDARTESIQGLRRAAKWIRAELGHRMDLKYVPKLTFVYDDSTDYAENIESLINKIKKESNEPPNGPSGEAG